MSGKIKGKKVSPSTRLRKSTAFRPPPPRKSSSQSSSVSSSTSSTPTKPVCTVTTETVSSTSDITLALKNNKHQPTGSQVPPNRLLEIDKDELNDLFLYIFSSCTSNLKKSLEKWPEIFDKIRVSDLNTIKYKCCENLYANVTDFDRDVQNFTRKYENDTVMKPLIKAFRCHLNKDLNESKKCVSCVVNYYVNDFTKVCNHPHALIWARHHSYPFWPAKVYYPFPGRNSVQVKFFGEENDLAEIKTDSNTAYVISSVKYPKQLNKRSLTMKEKEALEIALNQLRTHIKELKNNFPNKAILPDQGMFGTKLIPYDGSYLYLKDVEVNDHEMEIEDNEEPDSSFNGTVRGSDFESIKTDPQYQPRVIVEDFTDFILTHKPQLLKPHLKKSEIKALRAKAWNPDEYPEEKVDDPSFYDKAPGIDVNTLDITHQTLMERYLSTVSERRMRRREEVKSDLVKEINELSNKIKVAHDFNLKRLEARRRENSKEFAHEQKKIENERKSFEESLKLKIHPEIQSLILQHESEIASEKAKPYCRVCFKPALRQYSDDGLYCSDDCVESTL